MNKDYIILSLYIILWFTLGLVVPVIIKIWKGNTTIAKALEPKLDNVLLYSYFFITLCIFFVCFIKPVHKLKESEEVLNYAKRDHLDTYEFYCYYEKVQRNQYDFESLFNLNVVNKKLTDVHSSMDLRLLPNFKYVEGESGYSLLINSENLEDRDLGFFGIAMCNFINNSNTSETLLNLEKISNKKKGFVNYLYSMCVQSDSGKIRYLREEILNKGAIKAATEQLCNIYSQNNSWDDFEKIYNSNSLKFYVSQKSMLKYLQYKGYYLEYFQVYFKPIGVFVIMCVIIFMFSLFYLFMQIHPKISKEIFSIIFIFLSSLLFCLLNIYISNSISFRFEQNPLIQRLEFVLISELLKMVPFLFLFYFSKKKRQPIDYLFYAGISALGFCGINLMVDYSNHPINSIFGTVIFQGFSEICSTAFFVYVLILGKFYYQKNSLPFFLAGFFVAVVSSFLYKWLDLTEGPANLILLIIVFFSQLWCFIHTISNCLSNSFSYMLRSVLNATTVSKVLVAIMLLFEIMVYLYNSAVISDEFATEKYFTMGVIYFPVIYLFSIIIRRIDPFPGEWEALSFKKLADPKIFFAGLNPEYNYLIGKEVSLTPHGRQTKSLTPQLPVKGHIVTRRKIDNYKGWFEMELNYPLKFKGNEVSTVYFRSELKDEPLFKEFRNQVKIFIPNTGSIPVHLDQMAFVDIVSLYI